MLSIITPTYNRSEKILRSVSSSIQVLNDLGEGELIIVDDCSTDNTVNIIKNNFSEEMNSGMLKYYRLSKNIGVTGAKNYGAKNALGEWIIFMDSDDEFIGGISLALEKELKKLKEYSLVFFRCRDMLSNRRIGPDRERGDICLTEMLNHGTPGECLPALRRDVFLGNSYSAELRGCEGLLYYSILSKYGKGFVSDLILRSYDLEGNDKITTSIVTKERSSALISFYVIVLRQYSNDLSLRSKVLLYLKIILRALNYIRAYVKS